jgi:hypothetical protein
MTTQATTDRPASVGWRTPAVVVISGCLIAMIAFGPRSSLGFTDADVAGYARPRRGRPRHPEPVVNRTALCRRIADRFGSQPRDIAGAVFYALGLALMAHHDARYARISAGVLIELDPAVRSTRDRCW